MKKFFQFATVAEQSSGLCSIMECSSILYNTHRDGGILKWQPVGKL